MGFLARFAFPPSRMYKENSMSEKTILKFKNIKEPKIYRA
jgi:hypothetical protein